MTKVGFNTSETVVESVQKAGGQPEEEEKKMEDPGTETTANALQNLAIRDNACDRTSWNGVLMCSKYRP